MSIIKFPVLVDEPQVWELNDMVLNDRVGLSNRKIHRVEDRIVIIEYRHSM